jgi:hypothetical protein
MQRGKNTKDFGVTILVLVLFFLFASSFTRTSRLNTNSKPKTESFSGYQLNYPAQVTVNSNFDQEDIFTSVIKKYPNRTINEVKRLNYSILLIQRMATLRKIEFQSGPAPQLRLFCLYQYHYQNDKDYPALG